MKSRFLIAFRNDRGIAMIVALFAVVVVTVMGSVLVVTGIRDLDSSVSVQRSSTALGIAEAGVQHAIQQLKVHGPIGGEIGRCVKDKSVPGGWGQFMNPTDRLALPFYDALDPNALSTDPNKEPTNCGAYEGWVGTGRYTVFGTGVSATELIDLPGERIGTYVVTAVGFDRRDLPSRPGERTVQQNVRVETVDVPFSLFSKEGVFGNGTPRILNESIYTTGNLTFRNKIDFQPASADPDCPYPDGCDIFYGWDSATQTCRTSPAAPNAPCPVAAHSTGTIYSGGATPSKKIHPPPATQNCEFPYDRDSIGAGFSVWNPPPLGVWDCTASGYPPPPWSTSFFDNAQLPFNPEGPSEDVYQFLKTIAKSNGTFCRHVGGGQLNIPPGTATPACKPIADYLNSPPPGDKFAVFYIEVAEGNVGGGKKVSINATWGPQPPPEPQDVSPCGKHFGIIIIRGGDLTWDGTGAWWGSAFVPEGNLHASGIGDTWFVGTVYAKSMDITGNMKFQLNDCWLDSVTSPAFFLVKRLRWHESDR